MSLDQTSLIGLVEYFSHYSLILAFIVPALGGEAAVLFLAFLAGQGMFPLWSIIVGSFLGMLTLDAFWFFVPRSPWAEKIKARYRAPETYRKLEARLESISHRNDIVILFFSKVLVGTRILVLAYLSLRKLSFRKFLTYNAVATFLWALCLGYSGWLAGVGFYSLPEASQNITSGALYVALIIAVYYSIVWCIRLWIEKK